MNQKRWKVILNETSRQELAELFNNHPGGSKQIFDAEEKLYQCVIRVPYSSGYSIMSDPDFRLSISALDFQDAEGNAMLLPDCQPDDVRHYVSNDILSAMALIYEDAMLIAFIGYSPVSYQ